MQSFLKDIIFLFVGFIAVWVAINSLVGGSYYPGGILLCLGLPLIIFTLWIADGKRKRGRGTDKCP